MMLAFSSVAPHVCPVSEAARFIDPFPPPFVYFGCLSTFDSAQQCQATSRCIQQADFYLYFNPEATSVYCLGFGRVFSELFMHERSSCSQSVSQCADDVCVCVYFPLVMLVLTSGHGRPAKIIRLAPVDGRELV